MALDAYRNDVEKYLVPIAKRCSRFHPSTLTFIGLLLSFLAALLLYFGYVILLPLAFVTIFFASLFDAIDGKVARLTGKVSRWGDFLDHVVDRYSDVLLLGGVMFSPYATWQFGFFAMIGMLLTSYIGTQAQAVGLKRLYAGVLGRAERLVILMFIPLVQFAVLSYSPNGKIWLYTPYDYMLILFAVVGNITAVQRCWLVYKRLKKEDGTTRKKQ